jgi:hypothetical protein
LTEFIATGDLVFVEWMDSRLGEGWTVLEDLRPRLQVVRCQSVGWIIARDSKSLTLASHFGDNPDQCCGDMTIPVKVIVRVIRLPIPLLEQKGKRLK